MNISIVGVSFEALMLSSKSFCGISNGFAYNSSAYKPSFVLTEMGLEQECIKEEIRVNWGSHTDLEVTKLNFQQLLSIVEDLI